MIDAELQSVLREELSLALEQLFALGDAREAGGDDADFVRKAFRVFHNVKGAVRIAGLARLELLAHCVEDQLGRLRETAAAPTPALVAQMREALSLMLSELETGREDAAVDRLLGELGGLALPATEPDVPAAAPSEANGAAGRPGAVARDLVRVDAARLDRLMGLGSEYLAQQQRLQQRQRELRAFADRLNSLARLEREQRVVRKLARELEALLRVEERELRRGAQLSSDFDRAMRDARMQPLSSVTGQFLRAASDTARELGKELQNSIDVGEIELDRQVLDALRDPLLHLVRNAVDHGIEAPDARVRAGKPARGQLQIEARLHGAYVEIDVSDDGRGIDPERVLARALELGLASSSEAAKNPTFVEDMLFSPGFSTASSVSQLSGRGVGLDVVRSRMAELGGQVALVPQRVGTRFRVTVPTSVLSLRGLLVRAGAADFVLPSSHVQRTLRLRASEVKSAEGQAVVAGSDGEPLRLRWLATLMDQPRSDDAAILNVVVVGEGQQRHGLVVDEVRGDTSAVIKRLPWNVRRVRGVIGASHQGDAALALVLDVAQLLKLQAGGADRDRRLQLAVQSAKRRILVADDSLTSRTLERNILSGAGYEVETAVDGDAAWRALENAQFDLLVSDVQMPGLDGFELARRVRADARMRHMPIVLVTSLDRPEDVSHGAAAGANEYIVKGRFDQQALLETVSRLI